MSPDPKKPKKRAPFPSRNEILQFIQDSPGKAGKREIARAFQLDADQKRELKKLLRSLEQDGKLQKGRGRRYADPGTLPAVSVVRVSGVDTDGELLARPDAWEDETPEPTIYMAPEKRGRSALAIGDRVLAKLDKVGANIYEGRTIRRLSEAPALVLGIFEAVQGENRLRPIDRRAKSDFIIQTGDDLGARPGDLVRAEIKPGRKLGLRKAKIIERLHDPDGAQSISLIAIHDHDIPTQFTLEALKQADSAKAPTLKGRTDLRKIPLVTIDGADARDFDDAVWAEADPDPKNTGGWHLLVAIADVSWYVRPGDALDEAAYERGNSVYFPDRVVPMLPEALSNGWCSLNPREDRSCLAAHLWIDKDGALIRHEFVRGLMKSAARLTYGQAQAAADGNTDDLTGPLLETVIKPLYGAYEALAKARRSRGVLELELPERRVLIGEDGSVAGIEQRARYDSHKLIEEFMITANVAAAETLEKLHQPCLYRIHDVPTQDKLESLRQFLDSIGLKLARGQTIKPQHFNNILKKTQDTPHQHLVNEVVLRSQAQAQYAPDNIGHFGLALRRYCHFTSPIRRYADLLVHRALIRGLKLGEGGLEDKPKDFADMGEHISNLERRAAQAERSAIDRFTAAFLADRIGTTFGGRINGVTRFGLFVTLDEIGGDGLLPIRSLPDDYYIHDEDRHELRGRSHRLRYRLGDAIEVRLAEADAITGGMILELMDAGAPAGPRKGKNKKASGKRKGKQPSKGRRRRS